MKQPDQKLEDAAGKTASPDWSEAWLSTSRFALLLAALIGAAFPRVVLGWQSFVIRDFGLFSYPVAQFQREAFWRGELPLWNPYNFCGLPFLAQWNTMCLYPPALVYLLLPLTWGLGFFCLAHLFWGGLGMYLLARAWTRNSLAAGLAGVLFAFNGLSLTFLMWPSHVATFAWAPWVIMVAERGWRRSGAALLPAVFAGAAQMLAGGPETILFAWGFLFLLACGDVVVGHAPGWRIAARFAGIVLGVAAVSAAQLLPTLHLVWHSQRYAGFGRSDWAMPIWGWANLLVPVFKAFADAQGVLFQPGQSWTTSYYTGVAALFLAVISLKRNRDWWVMGLLVVTALVLALGDAGWAFRILRRIVPAVGFLRYPIKAVILLELLIPLLAASGIAAVLRRAEPFGVFERMVAGLVVALIALTAIAGWKFPTQVPLAILPLSNGATRIVFFLLIVALLELLQRITGGARVGLGLLLLVGTWLDLWLHVPTQNPTARPLIYGRDWTAALRDWKPAPALGASRAMLSPIAGATLMKHRLPDLETNYLVSRLVLQADANLLDHIPTPFGFYSLIPEEINNATVLPYMNTNHAYAALLDFMGVAQITSAEDPLRWLPRPTALPLVTAGQKVFIASDNSAYEGLSRTNIDFGRIVVLPPEAEATVTATQRVGARVLASTFETHRVIVEAETPANSVVVISQTWYPAWKARMDGLPVRVWRANYAFQAVQLPPGRHRIELYYRDDLFVLGAWISALGLATCAALGFVMRRHRKEDGVNP
jgi:hypothetical protein